MPGVDQEESADTLDKCDVDVSMDDVEILKELQCNVDCRRQYRGERFSDNSSKMC